MSTKYFIDSEFIEDGETIDLISIAIVCEDGREYYAVSKEFSLFNCSEWLWKNVLPHLPNMGSDEWKYRAAIKQDILEFIQPSKPKPVFWGYYADYDWVVLCWLFGRMIDLPKHFPYYCRDLKQLVDDAGNPKIPRIEGVNHNALNDARRHKTIYDYITSGEYAI